MCNLGCLLPCLVDIPWARIPGGGERTAPKHTPRQALEHLAKKLGAVPSLSPRLPFWRAWKSTSVLLQLGMTQQPQASWQPAPQHQEWLLQPISTHLEGAQPTLQALPCSPKRTTNHQEAGHTHLQTAPASWLVNMVLPAVQSHLPGKMWVFKPTREC